MLANVCVEALICVCGERHAAVSEAGSAGMRWSLKQPKSRRVTGVNWVRGLGVREVPRWLIKHRVKGEPAPAAVMAAR